MTEPYAPPVPVLMMMALSWEQALHDTRECAKDDGVAFRMDPVAVAGCRATFGEWRTMAVPIIDQMFENGHGEYGVAFLMLCANPLTKTSFARFMPMLSRMVKRAIPKLDATSARDYGRMLDVWWSIAEQDVGKLLRDDRDIFALADRLYREKYPESGTVVAPAPVAAASPMMLRVMPAGIAKKSGGDHSIYVDALSRELPLLLCPPVAPIIATLNAEFPHAVREIALLCRDLREGKPVRISPVLIVGAPGGGKSRLVRRFGELCLGGKLFRYDASGVGDGSFSGSAKSWSNTQPSAPARSIAQLGLANPMMLIDEIDKAGTHEVGSLYRSLTPFLERETSKRHRDISLDAELDLSWISYICTANDDKPIAPHIMDRLRIIRMPSPGLPYLPQLADQVRRDLAREADENEGFYPAFSEDELAVIGKAWAKGGLSMRVLQRCCNATLGARAACAPRH
ncbi:ATP-dependent Lon protease [Nitrobacteraceae bacterium AZCC 2161]